MTEYYYLTTAKYNNELRFYIEKTDKELTEFFTVEDSISYFERTKRNNMDDIYNLILRKIAKYSTRDRLTNHKIINKTELRKFMKIHFPYELKFYN